MNRIFSVLWSHALRAWVVVSELSRRQGKGKAGADRSGNGVPNRRIGPATLASGISAGLLVFFATPTLAANECGIEAAGADTLTCSSGTYGTGIIYTNSDGLTLDIDGSAVVVGNPGVSVGSAAANTRDIVINGNFGSIASDGTAIRAQNAGASGNASVTLTSGDVTTLNASGYGLLSQIANAASAGAASATVNGGSITTQGAGADAVRSQNGGLGGAILTINSGAITVLGNSSAGALSTVSNANSLGAASAMMSGGSISTTQPGAIGLASTNAGLGDATALMTAGSIGTRGNFATGLYGHISNTAGTGNVLAKMEGGSITTEGARYAQAVYAYQQGLGAATAEMTGGAIQATGTTMWSGGVQSEIRNANSMATSSVFMSGGSIETVNGIGLYSRNTGMGDIVLTMSGGSILTTGRGWGAIFADNSNYRKLSTVAVLFSGGTVEARGDFATGIMTDNESANDDAGEYFGGPTLVEVSGGRIRTSGSRAPSIYATGTGIVDVAVSDGQLDAAGANSDGIYAETYSNDSRAAYVIDLSGGTVIGGTDRAAAVRTIAATGGTIDISGSAVVDGTASGIAIRDGDANYNGVDEKPSKAVLTLSGGTVKGDVVLGLGDDVFSFDGGELTGDVCGDDPQATSNDGNDTFRFAGGTWAGNFQGGNGSDAVTVSSVGYDGTQILDGGDDTGIGDGWFDTLTLSGVTATANGTSLRNWETVMVDGGALAIADGAWVVGVAGDPGTGVFLTGGGALDARNQLQLAGNLTLDAGSNFITHGGGAGVYEVNGSVNNAGRLLLGDGVVGDVLTVNGNYVGTNGQVVLDAVLGGDASGADRLVIQGNASGTTKLLVRKVGVTGAQTTGGISMVTVMGTVAQDAFALGHWDYTTAIGEHALIAGAYGYTLRQTSDGWRLVSELTPAVSDPANPVDPINPVNPINPVAPIDPVVPVNPKPLYQPGVPVYEAYPKTLLALNGVPTLQQRVGNRAWAGEDATYPAGGDSGFWSRFEGRGYRPTAKASTSGIDTDLDIWRLQFGVGREWHRGRNQNLVGGLTASHGRARNAVESVYGSGMIDTKSASLGTTLTWYGPQGIYVDAQAQLSRYRSDLRSHTLGMLAKSDDGRGRTFSLELGDRIPLGERIALTPQFQAVYSKVDFDGFVDPADASVGNLDGDSLKTRWGLAVDYQKKDAAHRSRLYVIANVSYDWRDGTRVNVSGTPLWNQDARTWGELSFGGTYGWGRHLVYFEAGAQASLDGPSSRAVAGTVGYRASW